MMGVFAAVGKYCPHPKILHTTIPFLLPREIGSVGGRGKNKEKIVFISSTKQPEDLPHSKTSD